MELVDKAILGKNKRKKQRDRDTQRDRESVCVWVCVWVCVPTCACPLIHSSRSHCFSKGASRQYLKTQVSQL